MNRFSLRQALLAILCGLAVATSSQATTITFDSVASSGNPEQLSPITTSGFTFSSSHFHTIDSPGSTFGGIITDGSIFIAQEAGGLGQPITMAPSGGGAFSLNSLFSSKLFINSAAAAAGGFPNADFLNILGNLSGGGTVTATFALGSSFQQFFLPASFTGLSSVVFSGSLASGGAGGISLDTLVANTASVPDGGTTGILLFLTMLGLGFAARKANRPKRARQSIKRNRK